MISKDNLMTIVSKALKIPKRKVNMDLKLGEIEEWDSLGHLEILIKIDKETKGRASKIKNLSDCDTVRKIYENLKKNKLVK